MILLFHWLACVWIWLAQVPQWNSWLYEVCGSQFAEAIPASWDAVSARWLDVNILGKKNETSIWGNLGHYTILLSQTAHYDKCVVNLREQYKPDMSPVLDYIFSHAQVSKKNILVTMLIVRPSLPSILPRIHSAILPMLMIYWKTHCMLCRTSCVEGIQR